MKRSWWKWCLVLVNWCVIDWCQAKMLLWMVHRMEFWMNHWMRLWVVFLMMGRVHIKLKEGVELNDPFSYIYNNRMAVNRSLNKLKVPERYTKNM